MVRMDQWLAEKEKEQKRKQTRDGEPGGQSLSGKGKKEADGGSGADL